MFRRLVPSLALLFACAAPACAADIFPEVSGVAQFPNSNGPKTDLIASGTVLPGGGRAFDFGEFGQGGASCSAYAGQADWLCASASARVEIDRQLVATTTYVGTATSMVETAKNVFAPGAIPTVNMWCAHTPRLMKPIDTEAATMNG